jgi:hypothetical protein
MVACNLCVVCRSASNTRSCRFADAKDGASDSSSAAEASQSSPPDKSARM